MKYFQDRIRELHNVTWPTQNQAVHSMIVVLVIMLLTGMFITLSDYALSEIVLGLINKG